jgi:hypothetical protein
LLAQLPSETWDCFNSHSICMAPVGAETGARPPVWWCSICYAFASQPDCARDLQKPCPHRRAKHKDFARQRIRAGKYPSNNGLLRNVTIGETVVFGSAELGRMRRMALLPRGGAAPSRRGPLHHPPFVPLPKSLVHSAGDLGARRALSLATSEEPAFTLDEFGRRKWPYTGRPAVAIPSGAVFLSAVAPPPADPFFDDSRNCIGKEILGLGALGNGDILGPGTGITGQTSSAAPHRAHSSPVCPGTAPAAESEPPACPDGPCQDDHEDGFDPDAWSSEGDDRETGDLADGGSSEEEDALLLQFFGETGEWEAARRPARPQERPSPAAAVPPEPGGSDLLPLRPRWRGQGREPRWHKLWADRKEQEALALPACAFSSAPDDAFGELARRASFLGAGGAPAGR